MKLIKKIIICSLIFTFIQNNCTASEYLELNESERNKIKLSPKKEKIEGSMVISEQEKLSTLINIQKSDEIKDIEILWNATINNNTLIKFTMNKLNMPESQRRLHSSVLAKSLSALVYGASFVPMFMGGNSLLQSASFTTGRLANNFINKENTNQTPPLSDTELIQLAGTIEQLQDTIISTYYDYKGALAKLKDIRAKLILYNKNYSHALKNNDEIEIAISSSLYEDVILQECLLEHEAKKFHLALERLAGKDAVNSLILSQYAIKNQLLNLKKEKG